LDPSWKESYSSLVPADFVSTAWYYTKVVLKALFMNAPASKPTEEDGVNHLPPALQTAVDELEAATE